MKDIQKKIWKEFFKLKLKEIGISLGIVSIIFLAVVILFGTFWGVGKIAYLVNSGLFINVELDFGGYLEVGLALTFILAFILAFVSLIFYIPVWIWRWLKSNYELAKYNVECLNKK